MNPNQRGVGAGGSLKGMGMMTFGEIAGIISLVWLVFEKSLKLIREIRTPWERMGVQTIEWPVCHACSGRGERGPQERVCLVCKGSGRLSPGTRWRIRKTLRAFFSN